MVFIQQKQWRPRSDGEGKYMETTGNALPTCFPLYRWMRIIMKYKWKDKIKKKEIKTIYYWALNV